MKAKQSSQALLRNSINYITKENTDQNMSTDNYDIKTLQSKDQFWTNTIYQYQNKPIIILFGWTISNIW